MSFYYLDPLSNTPTTNLNNKQPIRLSKKTQESEFDKTLKAENISTIKKNVPKNIAEIKKSASTSNITVNKLHSKNSLNYLEAQQALTKNGTNLALIDLTDKLAEEVVAILMGFAMKTSEISEGEFAASIYQEQAINELARIVGKDFIEEFSKRFYEESLNMKKVNEDNEERKTTENIADS